jgi:hypothetical protein
MRKLLFVILICSAPVYSFSQTIEVSSGINGKKVIIKNHSDYDSENKPVIFDLTVKLPVEKVTTCIIDIFRLMEDNQTKELSKQYFKTIILTKKDAITAGNNYKWLNSIRINDLFELDKSRFITTKGIIFDFCISSKFLVSINERTDCLASESLQINLSP